MGTLLVTVDVLAPNLIGRICEHQCTGVVRELWDVDFCFSIWQHGVLDLWAQFQNPGPHQRPLDVAATGCAKYVRDNLHVNETIRKITIHK